MPSKKRVSNGAAPGTEPLLGGGIRDDVLRSKIMGDKWMAQKPGRGGEKRKDRRAESGMARPKNRESERSLAEEATALARLNEASSRLWRTQDLRKGLDEILWATIELMRADFGNIQLFDAARGVLHIAAQRGFTGNFLEHFREVRGDSKSASGRALGAGRRIIIEDVEKDPSYAPHRAIARATGYRAVQSTPLLGRDLRPLGMISTHFRVPHRPSEVDLQRLDLYARQTADFIERCRIEEALRESQTLFAKAFNSSPDAIVISRIADGQILQANPAWETIFGFNRNEAVGRTSFELNIYADPADRRRVVAELRKEGAIRDFKLCVRRKSGESREVLLNSEKILFGRDECLLSITRDITESKRAEEALRESEEHYRVLLKASSDVVYQMNADWTEMRHLVGRDFIDDTIKPERHWLQKYIHPQDQGRVMAAVRRAIRTRSVFELEHRVLRVDGSLGWTFSRAVPILDAKRKIREWFGMATDVSARKWAEAALRENEERLRAILSSVADAVISLDRRGVITSVNASTERIFGYGGGEMLGRNVNMLISSPHQRQRGSYLMEYLRIGDSDVLGNIREVRHRRKDGTQFPAELTVTESGNGKFFTAVIRDLTERRRLEEEVLQISEEERQRVAADLHDGICQELMGISYVASAVRRDLEEAAPNLALKVKSLADSLAEAAGHTRAVARGMNPVVTGGDGLMLALGKLAERINHSHRLDCRFECREPVLFEDAVASNQLYRIAQEAVQNAVRHAKATRIILTLGFEKGGVWLSVKDNGRGMAEGARRGAGIGIRTMRYRADLIGARITLQRARRGGTEVLCHLPQG